MLLIGSLPTVSLESYESHDSLNNMMFWVSRQLNRVADFHWDATGVIEYSSCW